MSLRPIDLVGLHAILDLVGPTTPEADRCTFLHERLPRSAWTAPILELPREEFLVADPVALYWFMRMWGRGMPEDAMAVIVIIPYGETVEAGMLVQSFAVQQRKRMVFPQDPVRLLTLEGEIEVEQGRMIEGENGPTSMSDGFFSEVGHGFAALQSSLELGLDSDSDDIESVG